MPQQPQQPTSDLAAELALASDAARRAGALQMARYGGTLRVRHKGPRDVVTEVDHASEALILGAIRAAFPDDAILAEESGGHRGRRGKGAAPTEGAGRAWLVDPLDGTINYANGVPFFSVSIGLAVDGRAALGVVYDPARDELYHALAGGGAHLNGTRVRLPVKEHLADCLITLALPFRGWRARERTILRATRVNRVLGSSALALAYVANGRFDCFIQARGLSNWDVAAAGLIAREAGATVTDLAGGAWLDVARPSRSVAVVAAAARHHATLMRLLAGEPLPAEAAA
ncbi:MAG: inositol monophosphatase family protein [Candidatus Limnocylindrales bacterium]